MEHNDGSLSYHLYNEMMEFVGTPNMVRKRRLFFKSLNTVASNRFASVICSGSKAEGLNMPGSDLDVMLSIKGSSVHNDESSVPYGKNEFYLDTKDVSAGFAHIKIKQDLKETKHLVHTENGVLLKNGICRENYNILASKFIFGVRPTLKVHGPCLSTIDDSLDVLYAFPCKSWPDIASNWPSRPRSSEWPSNNLINNTLKGGVLLAPIGSKFGSTQDNPNEWRLSFSVAEIMLVHSFNHTQLTCYAMLKLVLKEIIDKNSATEKLLCSYYIKTILFWMIEESGYNTWRPHKLFQCFRVCLKRLYYLVKHGQCPNYFIPENNMFEGRILGHTQKELSFLLETLYSEGINAFWRSKTLSKYLSLVYESGMPNAIQNETIDTNEVDRAIYPLLHHMDHLSVSNFVSLESRIYRAVFHIMHGKGSNFEKAIHLLYFANECKYFCMEGQYNMTSKNKVLYFLFKRHVFNLLIGTHFDSASGWLSLAAFFYRHQHYKQLLIITDFILTCRFSSSNHLIDYYSMSETVKYTAVSRRCKSFIKRHKQVCGNSVFGSPIEGSVYYKTDVFVNPGDFCNVVLSCSPPVFARFLIFMSFHHMQDLTGRQNALFNLQKATEDAPVSSPLLINDIMYLNRALKMAKAEFPVCLFPKLASNFSILSAKSTLIQDLEYFIHPEAFNLILDSNALFV